jgi:hypothetical protein
MSLTRLKANIRFTRLWIGLLIRELKQAILLKENLKEGGINGNGPYP